MSPLRRIATAPGRAWRGLAGSAGATMAVMGVLAVVCLLGLTGSALHRADLAQARVAKLVGRLQRVEGRIEALLGRERCLLAGVKSAQDRIDHHATVTALLAIAVGRERPPLWDVPEPAAVTCSP